MSHITLVRPPMLLPVTNVGGKHGSPSIGLAYVTSALKKAGHQVTVIDAFGEAVDNFTKIDRTNLLINGLTAEEIVERIPANTEYIGVSCMFSNDWLYSKMVLREIYNAFPHIPIIGGGEHFTADPNYSFVSTPFIHSMVMGEGEETIVELISAIENNKSLEMVPGIAYLKDGEVSRTPARARIKQIDDIAWPSWEEVPLRKYLDNGYGMSAMGGRMMPMIASRGCPYKCTFCSNPEMWGNRWISRDPSSLIVEIEDRLNEFNIDHFDFYDLTAIVNRKWTLEFCNLLIEKNLNITWSLPSGTRSEALDYEVLKAMKESGCNSLTYAPESGSLKTLSDIKKRVNLDKMIVSIRGCVKLGITTKANIVFGFPDQNLKQIMESLFFMVKLAWAGVEDAPVNPFVPYPGSELYYRMIKNGRVKIDDQEKYELFLAKNVYSELATVTSYSEHFSDRGLQFIVILGSLWFYSFSFLFRPWRVLTIGWNVLKKEPKTMLERVLEGILANFFTRKRKRNIVKFVDIGVS